MILKTWTDTSILKFLNIKNANLAVDEEVENKGSLV